jgi:Flp pilus assembly protein TadG
MVEFALVAQLMLFVTFAIIDFGRYMFIEHTLLYATYKGARTAMVGASTSSIRTNINAAAAPAVDTSTLLIYSYVVTGPNYADPDPLPAVILNNTTVPPGTVGGAYMKLRIKYAFNFLTPFIQKLLPSAVVIDRSAQYRVEKF